MIPGSIRVLLLLLGLIGTAAAGNAPPDRDLRSRVGIATARATASFQSADAIEANLRAGGATLHSRIVTLRAMVEASLDAARTAINGADEAEANEAVYRVEALLDRFSRLIGAD